MQSNLRSRLGGLAALLGLLLAAAFFRPPVTIVGPLLPEIGRDLGLSAVGLSTLGAIPVIGFGLGAFLTPVMARRWDSRQVLKGVVAVLLAAVVLRATTGLAGVLAGTAVIGLAIAVGNTILPAIVRQDFPDQVGRMTGIYTTVMSGAAGLAAWLAVPLAEGGDWRRALAAPAVIGAVALLALLVPTGHRATRDLQHRDLRPLLGDAAAWQVTLFMGLQSIGFYAVMTWLPTLLQDNGFSPAAAGSWLSYAGTIGIPLGLALPWLLRRVGNLSVLAVAAGVIATIGTAGLAIAPTAATWLWLTLMGLGQGVSFPIALAAISARAADPETTTSLSAMAQGFGYLIAAAGTYSVGLIFSVVGDWRLPTLALAGFAAAQAWVGWTAGHGRAIGGGQR